MLVPKEPNCSWNNFLEQYCLLSLHIRLRILITVNNNRIICLGNLNFFSCSDSFFGQNKWWNFFYFRQPCIFIINALNYCLPILYTISHKIYRSIIICLVSFGEQCIFGDSINFFVELNTWMCGYFYEFDLQKRTLFLNKANIFFSYSFICLPLAICPFLYAFIIIIDWYFGLAVL